MINGILCLSPVSPVMAEDVRLSAPGQQADVHHAISADPVRCRQRHAALLRPGGHGKDGPRNHPVSVAISCGDRPSAPSSSRAFVLSRLLFPSAQRDEATPLWGPRQVRRTNQNQRAAETLRPHWTQMEQEAAHLQVMANKPSSGF